MPKLSQVKLLHDQFSTRAKQAEVDKLHSHQSVRRAKLKDKSVGFYYCSTGPVIAKYKSSSRHAENMC